MIRRAVPVRSFKHRFSLAYLTLTVPPKAYDAITDLDAYAYMACNLVATYWD